MIAKKKKEEDFFKNNFSQKPYNWLVTGKGNRRLSYGYLITYPMENSVVISYYPQNC